MGNRQHESLFSVEVGQGDHATSPLQELERLPIPALQFQELPEAAALVGQLLGPDSVPVLARNPALSWPTRRPRQHRSTGLLSFQHAAERTTLVTLATK